MAIGNAYRAKVSRVGTSGVWVTGLATYPGVEFGPCDILANAVRLDSTPTVGYADYLQAGDSVMVIDTGNADFVIAGTIRTGVSPTGGL